MKPGDVAIIFTPDDTHFRLAAACIAAGLHVLVAKPIVKTLAEHKELVELARRQNVLVSLSGSETCCWAVVCMRWHVLGCGRASGLDETIVNTLAEHKEVVELVRRQTVLVRVGEVQGVGQSTPVSLLFVPSITFNRETPPLLTHSLTRSTTLPHSHTQQLTHSLTLTLTHSLSHSHTIPHNSWVLSTTSASTQSTVTHATGRATLDPFHTFTATWRSPSSSWTHSGRGQVGL